MNTPSLIEALLFWKAEPISFKKIASLLSIDQHTVQASLRELENTLKGRGLALVYTDDQVMLGTSPEASPVIEQFTKDELSQDISKAGLETLSIILYQGPISRADIDYIRGVNSQFIVRNLLVRGLIERVDNPADSRSFLYRACVDLLVHLGISKIEDMPEYENVRRDIESFKNNPQLADAQSGTTPKPPIS
jgi:segregation and condensation protein B